MDPNENVKEQNSLRLAIAKQEHNGLGVNQSDVDRLADLDEALSSWLYYGGTHPTEKLLSSEDVLTRIVMGL